MILTQQLILGLLVGGLYGLAATGLSLTFGVLRVLNVAHGELLMLGGYGTFWLFTVWKIDPFVSLLGVGPAMFSLGLLLYAVLFRFVVKAHEEARIKNSLLIGFGLTLVLHALAIQLWTADERSVTTGVQFFFNETKSIQQVSRFWLSGSRFENPVIDVEKTACVFAPGLTISL